MRNVRAIIPFTGMRSAGACLRFPLRQYTQRSRPRGHEGLHDGARDE